MRLSLIAFALLLTLGIGLNLFQIRRQGVRGQISPSRNLAMGTALSMAAVLMFPVILIYQKAGAFVTRMGIGPDTSQNIMAAQRYATTNDLSFGNLQDSLLQLSNTSDFNQAIRSLREIPNVRDQAFFDYAVSGYRVITTAISGEILSAIGTSRVLYLQVIMLTVCLTFLLTSIMLTSRLLKLKNIRTAGLALAVSISPLFHIQFMNGAWAQSLVLPSLILITAQLIFIIQNRHELSDLDRILVVLITTIFSTCSIMIYIESAAILIPLSFFTLYLAFRGCGDNRMLLKGAFFSSSISFLGLAPTLPFLLVKINQGISGYQSTGFKSMGAFQPWSLVGLGAYDTNWIFLPIPRGVALFLNISFSVLVFVAIRTLWADKTLLVKLSLVCLSLISTLSILSLFNVISHYMSLKASFLVFVVLATLSVKALDSGSLKDAKPTLFSQRKVLKRVTSTLLFITVSSGIIQISALRGEGSTWSTRDSQIFSNSTFKREISPNPVITTYIASAVWFGVIGDFNWVNKAPNVVDLSQFGDQEILILCFEQDPNCTPVGQERLTSLNAFGLKLWESGIDSEEFNRLTPAGRFSTSFQLTGQSPFEFQN
jgi:hypothetical protein